MLKVASVVVTVMLLVGCETNQYRKPCRVTGIIVEIGTPDQVSNVCTMYGRARNDSDGGIADPRSGNIVTGCTDAPMKKITVIETASSMLHELRHLLEYHCGRK